MSKKVYYTDGGCRCNPGLGAWAYALVSNDLCDDYDTGVKDTTTNNEMELTAIYQVIAIQVLPCELEIHSDSTYAINTISQWADNWIKNGTINSRPNCTLIKDIMTAKHAFESKGGKVSFVKVKGHSGNKWNDFVDRILNEAMDDFLDCSNAVVKVANKDNSLLQSATDEDMALITQIKYDIPIEIDHKFDALKEDFGIPQYRIDEIRDMIIKIVGGRV